MLVSLIKLKFNFHRICVVLVVFREEWEKILVGKTR